MAILQVAKPASCVIAACLLILDVGIDLHACQATSELGIQLKWSDLPSIPNSVGLAGGFAGKDGDSLLFAGGANFPDAPPWKDGKKVWHDVVYSLKPGSEQIWRSVGQLPRPLGYGVSLTLTSELIVQPGVLCCGGSDANRHYADCFVMRSNGGKLQIQSLPSLPKTCANAAGVIVDGVVYVAGGIETPTATQALDNFWALDLNIVPLYWQLLPTWPGEGRMLAVMATDGKSVFLLSGASITPAEEGKVRRTYLRDAYRYDPSDGWSKLADMPRAAVAAPSPAPCFRSQIEVEGSSKSKSKPSDQSACLIILGGDDGTLVDFKPLSEHPGFPATALRYSINQGHWDEIPLGKIGAQVTTPLIEYHGNFVIPSGETRPGVRTPAVRQLELLPR